MKERKVSPRKENVMAQVRTIFKSAQTDFSNIKDLGESTSFSACCSSSPGASPCLCLTNDYPGTHPQPFPEMLYNLPVAGGHVGEAGGGEVGVAEGRGCRGEDGRGEGVAGPELLSLARPAVEGSPTQALLSTGVGKEHREARRLPPFSGTPGEGTRPLVALLWTSIAVPSAFSRSSGTQASFRLLIFYHKGLIWKLSVDCATVG